VVANCGHLQNLKFSKAWIEKRLRGIAVRDELTDEWKKRGVREQRDFAILTAEISKATFGMTPSEYKAFKSLANPKDNRASILAKLPKRGESHA